MSARLAGVLGASAPWMLDGIAPFHMFADVADGADDADGADANAPLPVMPRRVSVARPTTVVAAPLHGAGHS